MSSVVSLLRLVSFARKKSVDGTHFSVGKIIYWVGNFGQWTGRIYLPVSCPLRFILYVDDITFTSNVSDDTTILFSYKDINSQVVGRTP